MAVTIESRAARARCFSCGSASVKAVCHHCWRPGCADHVRPVRRLQRRLLGGEGQAPGLNQAASYHCPDCKHTFRVRALAVGITGAVVTVIGAVIAWLSLTASLVLVLVGAGLVTWAYRDLRHGASRALAVRPVPAQPKVDKLRIREKWQACISLEPQGKYSVRRCAAEGELSLDMTFGAADRERVESWRRKTGSAHGNGIPMSAGCVVLEGPVGVKEGPDPLGTIVVVEGNTNDLGVFRTEDPHFSSVWNFKKKYEVAVGPEITSGPVWITPSIVPGSDRRALDLDIHWVDLGTEERLLSPEVMNLLRLEFPVAWGNVVQVNERAVQGEAAHDSPGQQALRSLECRQVSLTEGQRMKRRYRLSIRFEGRIESSDVLYGRLESTMKGTLSGLEGARLYDALGGRRKLSTGSTVKTRIEADFELSLKSICYQGVRIVPDRNAEDDVERYTQEFNVIPNDHTVIELTNAMSEDGYYVKRVIENPPRSGGRANLVQRYWDIAGRRYEGVYPYDFHLVLIGEEVHRGEVAPEAGKTKVRIIVHGAYTNDDMYDRIKREWITLRRVTADALTGLENRRPGSAPGTSFEEDPSTPSGGPYGARPDGVPTVTPVTQLSEFLHRLDCALLDNRITLEQYREMRERAEKHLGGS